MNHKHVQNVIEELQYSQTIDAWDAINDIIDYIEGLEENPVVDGKIQYHDERCVLNREEAKNES